MNYFDGGKIHRPLIRALRWEISGRFSAHLISEPTNSCNVINVIFRYSSKTQEREPPWLSFALVLICSITITDDDGDRTATATMQAAGGEEKSRMHENESQSALVLALDHHPYHPNGDVAAALKRMKMRGFVSVPSRSAHHHHRRRHHRDHDAMEKVRRQQRKR